MKLKTPKKAPSQTSQPAESDSPQTLLFPSPENQQQQSPADEAASLLESKPEPEASQPGEADPDGADLNARLDNIHRAVDARIAAGGHLNPDVAAEHAAFNAELTKGEERPITGEAEPGKMSVDCVPVPSSDAEWAGYADPPGEIPVIPPHVAMYERCLHDATQVHLEAALAREQLQGELKEAKDEEKAALKLVSKIKARGPEAYREAMKPVAVPVTENTAGGDAGASPQYGHGHHGPDPKGTPPAAVNTDESWRKVSLENLNLTAAMLKKLNGDGMETMGDFENRRVAVAEGKGKWPKYFGVEKLTIAEEAFLQWLSKNRDHQAVSQVAAEASTSGESASGADKAASTPATPPAAGLDTQQPTAAGAPACEYCQDASCGFCRAQAALDAKQPADQPPEPADSEPDVSPLKYPSTKAWDKMTDAAQTRWIEARAVELQVITSPPDEDELPMWQKGFDAFCEGDTLENCELPPGLDMDMWIVGWQAAKVADDAEEEEPEVKPTKPRKLAPASADSLDDLLA